MPAIDGHQRHHHNRRRRAPRRRRLRRRRTVGGGDHVQRAVLRADDHDDGVRERHLRQLRRLQPGPHAGRPGRLPDGLRQRQWPGRRRRGATGGGGGGAGASGGSGGGGGGAAVLLVVALDRGMLLLIQVKMLG